MKKKLVKILIILLAVLIIYTVFNQFDAKAASRKYSVKDLRGNPSFGLHNGFYHLWALPEPPGSDSEAPEILNKYFRLFHSQSDYQKYRHEWDDEDHQAYRNMYLKHWWKLINGLKTVNVHHESIKDLSSYCLNHKEKILSLQRQAEVLMKRYQKMIDCEVFEDFTAFDMAAPIPNLLIWLHIARQYNRFYILHALDGHWQEGTAKILHHLGFSKKATKGSIVLITNLVAKAITKRSLLALTSLMNRRDCPKEVFEQVLNSMPALQYNEYGSWPLIGEYLISYEYDWKTLAGFKKITFLEKNLLPLFTQKNRTFRYKDEFQLKIIERDKTPPYKWESGDIKIRKPVKGWFWWLQNPGGKVFFDKYIRDDILTLNTVVAKTFYTKTLYDMVRISAELHLHYTADKPVQEILNGLRTYQTLLDPCSGKPYKWSEEKQVLYSIGTDRKDDGGRYNMGKYHDTDFVLPCILYLK